MYRFRVGLTASLLVLSHILALSLWLAVPAVASADDYFTITVIDKTTGTPIPGIEIVTNNIVHTTDADGRASFFEPGLMDTDVFFSFPQCHQPFGASTKVCSNNSALECDAHSDCNLGFEPVKTRFFDSCFVGVRLTAQQQGTATMRMCPAGTAAECPQFPASCLPDVVLGPLTANPVPAASERFKIRVVDQQTGRGVPLIEVRSPNKTDVTDSAGVVAFHDETLMGTSVHLDIAGHGYFPTSLDLDALPGTGAEIAIERIYPAERLYRITGGGIYRDTILLGEAAPIAHPLLNARVIGQDSTQSTVYKDKVFWIWGDTSRPEFPLGNFRATGAQSELPDSGGLDPAVGVNLEYLKSDPDAPFVKEVCPVSTVPNPPGYGYLLCWMGGLATVTDDAGAERLYSRYSLVPQLGSIAEAGLVRFDDQAQVFEKQLVFPEELVVDPRGHPEKVAHGDVDYLYYIPTPVRILATEAALTNPSTYEAFTALQPGSDTELDFNLDGTLRYTWKTATRPITGESGIGSGDLIPADQKLFGHVKDPDSGAEFIYASSSTSWNEYRKRFVQIAQQLFGSSILGEIWFLEADTPMGPWVYSRKVVTHDNYTFYNVRHHPYFNRTGGREIFFEGTYTVFLTTAQPTPRYDYNQIMYRLDLDDERVILPVPIYDLSLATLPGDFVSKLGLRPDSEDSMPVFYANDRPTADTVPVYWSSAACRNPALVAGGTPATPPVFHALPADVEDPPATTLPLYEYSNAATGERAYSADPDFAAPGFVRNPTPIARVWENPIHLTLPVTDYLGALVADAGADICGIEYLRNSGARVTLDGSGSSHAAGEIASYEWTWSGGTASGVSPSIILPVGTHSITLTATGGNGLVSRDTLLVDVEPCLFGCCDVDALIQVLLDSGLPAWLVQLLVEFLCPGS